jgi:hypothetical protein
VEACGQNNDKECVSKNRIKERKRKEITGARVATMAPLQTHQSRPPHNARHPDSSNDKSRARRLPTYTNNNNTPNDQCTPWQTHTPISNLNLNLIRSSNIRSPCIRLQSTTVTDDAASSSTNIARRRERQVGPNDTSLGGHRYVLCFLYLYYN